MTSTQKDRSAPRRLLKHSSQQGRETVEKSAQTRHRPKPIAVDESGFEAKSVAEVGAMPRSWPLRIVAALAALLMTWHVFASFLWIFPPSPFRELVPGKALSGYMLPLFGQSWSVFAPEPINGDYHFNVRATVSNQGQEEVTGWVSASNVELSMVQNNLFPPRAGTQAEELASSQRTAWQKLSDEQREVVSLNYYLANAEERIRGDLEAAAGNDADQNLIEAYLAEDRMATAYATQVAKSVWGDEVMRVQFRVSRQNVVPFADRNKPDAELPEPHVVSTGWRSPLVVEHQNEEAFQRVFKSQFDRYMEGREQ